MSYRMKVYYNDPSKEVGEHEYTVEGASKDECVAHLAEYSEANYDVIEEGEVSNEG